MATPDFRAVLVILSPTGQRSRVTVDHFPFLLGRSVESHVILRDNRVSRSHSQILQESGQYILEDLNSSHGTWVNGKRVARHVLQNSDRIEFGMPESYQITFVLETPGHSGQGGILIILLAAILWGTVGVTTRGIFTDRKSVV